MMFISRYYATRSSGIPPNLSNLSRRTSLINWKLVSVSFIAGASLACSETVFDQYARLTEVNNNGMLPVKMQYELKSNFRYEELANCTSKDENWQRVENRAGLNDVFQKSENSLMGQLMNKPGGIMVTPAVFFEPSMKSTVTLVHLGYKMCGYPFLVHGGVIAALLNESIKASSILANPGLFGSPRKFKLESLSVSYRMPTLANQVLAIESSSPLAVAGSSTKKLIKSRVLSDSGKVLVESESHVNLI